MKKIFYGNGRFLLLIIAAGEKWESVGGAKEFISNLEQVAAPSYAHNIYFRKNNSYLKDDIVNKNNTEVP